MKVTRIQNSLKDLQNDIGNLERQLPQASKGKENPLGRGRSQSVTRNPNVTSGYRQPSKSHLTRTELRKQSESISRVKSRSFGKDFHGSDRNVICKEVIGDKNAPTRVEVVVRTKSSNKRSRSVQPSRTENEIPTRDHVLKNTSIHVKDGDSHRRNASWGHILQQQSSSTCDVKRNGHGHGKTLLYSSTDDDQSSVELEKWVQSTKTKSSHKSPNQMFGRNLRPADITDNYFSMFNPLRTLNFLLKELRGKVNEDGSADDNMQRIIGDMEKALCSISQDASRTTPPTKLVPPRPLQPQSASSRTKRDSSGTRRGKEKVELNNLEQAEVPLDNSANLVNMLLSTVSRITKIAGCPEKEEFRTLPEKAKQAVLKSPCVSAKVDDLHAQLELGSKQLEETCRQMEQTCENLRLQKNQLVNDLKHKSQQLESAMAKNQQLTIYAADMRQEILRVQQAAEVAQQESEKLKQRLLSQQREIQESNCHLNKRLEETVEDNERLNTELQLCHLEKDKLHILLSNKDLEVAKLKKEIVDIHTLVTEQLVNMRTLSGAKCSSEELSKMMQAVSKLHDTIDSANNTFLQKASLVKEGFKTHIGDGEGSRSRPVCSSPTSSVNSTLYSSWQLMSDITTPEQNPQYIKEKRDSERKSTQIPGDASSKQDEDSGIKVTTPAETLSHELKLKINETDRIVEKRQSAQELKAGIWDTFHLLKKQTSEAVNIPLPAPPKIFHKMQDNLGISQWTELSASESTVLFHSSDDSDTN